MKTKMMLSILTLMVSQIGLADNPPTPAPAPTTCNVLRTARATVYLHKHTWSQQSGVWVQSSTELAESNADVNVVAGDGTGCTYPQAVRLDNVPLNGDTLTVIVNAHVLAQDSSNNKVFEASYYLSSDGGKNSYAEAYSPDLTLKSIGVNFENQRAQTEITAHADWLSISVYFNDGQ